MLKRYYPEGMAARLVMTSELLLWGAPKVLEELLQRERHWLLPPLLAAYLTGSFLVTLQMMRVLNLVALSQSQMLQRHSAGRLETLAWQ